MKIFIITLFPEMFKEVLNTSILKRAQEKGLIEFELINLRDFGLGKRKQVDDTPYGGGAGMILRVDVVDKALSMLKLKTKLKLKTILLTPTGKIFNQKIAQKLAKEKHLVLICGHYEGFDERVRDLVDEEISIGQYVLSGGEIPAMVLIDAIVRLIPGVLGNPESLKNESFSNLKIENSMKIAKLKIENYLEYPQYTKPPVYKSQKVPAILLSGNHQKIAEWRKKKSIQKNKQN